MTPQEETFTIEEIKTYLLSQDSMGDMIYNLNAENIRKANQPQCPECGCEECVCG